MCENDKYFICLWIPIAIGMIILTIIGIIFIISVDLF